MKIAIICDLHLGFSGIGYWHNRVMFDHACEITEKTVFLLNSQPIDMVLILGDITHCGTERELTLAYKILNKLEIPWMILPGNHDRPSVLNGLFKKKFHDHLPCIFENISGIPSLFIYDRLTEINYEQTKLGNDIIDNAVDKIKNEKPNTLFIFSHIPLISQEDYAEKHNANYVPHYLDGNSLLEKISEYVNGRIFSFSGHQHWHHIVDAEKHLFCATASLVEYPMETRIIAIDNNKLIINTIETACPAIAEKSLALSQWVKGSKYDRFKITYY